MKQCMYCGNYCHDSDNTCIRCGNPLTAAINQYQNNAYPQQTDNNPKKKKTTKLGIIIGVVVVFMISMTVLSVTLWNHFSNDKTKKDLIGTNGSVVDNIYANEWLNLYLEIDSSWILMQSGSTVDLGLSSTFGETMVISFFLPKNDEIYNQDLRDTVKQSNDDSDYTITESIIAGEKYVTALNAEGEAKHYRKLDGYFVLIITRGSSADGLNDMSRSLERCDDKNIIKNDTMAAAEKIEPFVYSFSVGELKNNVYSNKWANIKIPLEEGWKAHLITDMSYGMCSANGLLDITCTFDIDDTYRTYSEKESMNKFLKVVEENLTYRDELTISDTYYKTIAGQQYYCCDYTIRNKDTSFLCYNTAITNIVDNNFVSITVMATDKYEVDRLINAIEEY